jgi:hypothetical protein
MSRCRACDVILGEYELKRRDKQTGLHADLCNTCYSHSNDAINEVEIITALSQTLSEKELDTFLTNDYNT